MYLFVAPPHYPTSDDQTNRRRGKRREKQGKCPIICQNSDKKCRKSGLLWHTPQKNRISKPQAAQHKAWRERQKAGQPKTRTLKELAAAQKEGEALTPEESERLEAHKSRKKIAREKLVRQAETDPAAAAELAKKRAYASEATKKSRQKMYEEAATGNPEAVERYENYLASRRETYHRKKQKITAEKTEQSA